MSFLDHPPLESSGLEAFIDPELWNAFVQTVLTVTVQGYQCLYEKGIAVSDWEEDLFSIHLEDCIRPIAFKKGIFVQLQSPTYTSDIKAGKRPAKQAKKLDLRMHGLWENYDTIHFIWECKRVAISSEKRYKDLIYDYVIDGIIRFLHEEWKYAHYVDTAGMLGYVLAGDTSNIVDGINQVMLTPPRKHKSTKSKSQPTHVSLSSYTFSETDQIRPASPISTFTDVYQSCHYRAFDAKKISLYHLFLSFDFNQ